MIKHLFGWLLITIDLSLPFCSYRLPEQFNTIAVAKLYVTIGIQLIDNGKNKKKQN